MSALVRNRVVTHLRAVAIVAIALLFGCEAKINTTKIIQTPAELPSISVSVVDNAGVPVVDATVTLYKKSALGATPQSSVQTDADGIATFDFAYLHAAEYLLYARKSGFVGGSTFAIVDWVSVLVGGIRLLPLSSLPDIGVANIPISGGNLSTQANADLPQSTVTFGPGALESASDVTIGTVTGGQIPVVPEGQVALNAVIITSSGNLTGSATISIGLPFDLPEGTIIPVSAFDEVTGTWSEIASGTVTVGGGSIVATINDIGSLSALAGMVSRRTSSQSTQIGVTRVLDQNSELVITTTYVPRLEFPSGTSYTPRTQVWLKGAIGGLVGVTFDEPLTLSVRRDPTKVQLYSEFEKLDRYIITVTVGTPAARPAVAARTAASFNFLGDSRTRDATLRDQDHNSGTGGGV